MAYDGFGERRLMLAVLEDAIRTLLLARRTAIPRKRLLRDLEWVESTSQAEPFAFETICDVLGIDASYLRDLNHSDEPLQWWNHNALSDSRPLENADLGRWWSDVQASANQAARRFADSAAGRLMLVPLLGPGVVRGRDVVDAALVSWGVTGAAVATKQSANVKNSEA